MRGARHTAGAGEREGEMSCKGVQIDEKTEDLTWDSIVVPRLAK